MSAALHQIAIIFIGILAGFICRKAKVLTEEGTLGQADLPVHRALHRDDPTLGGRTRKNPIGGL